MKKFLFGAFALIIFAGTSCKKDKDATCDLSSSSLSGNFKVTAATTQTGTNPEVNVYEAFFQVCERDDIFKFAENNTFTVTDAGVVCDPTSADSGTWALSGNVLTINSGGDISTFTVSNFNCNSFIISDVDAGVTSRITFTSL
ncbi:MAG: lipocalin family protein [Ferruginibacter sp.]